MYKEILISIDELENRIAVLENGTLVEIYIAREERQIGSIFKGRVANVLPGMQAAFVDIGLERNAFLCKDDLNPLGDDVDVDEFKTLSIKDILKVNQETLVQIVKESIGTKGARVTTGITLPGRYCVLLPTASYIGVSRRIESDEERRRLRQMADRLRPDGCGLIVRTAADGVSKEDFTRDLESLVSLWDKIQSKSKTSRAPSLIHRELTLVYKIVRDLFTEDVDRLIVDSPTEFDKIKELVDAFAPQLSNRVHLYTDRRPLYEVHAIDREIEKALKRQVWLESGAYLIIDKTEALTVIDVNTGKFIGRTSLADTILKTNLEAAKEIARQIRLRDVGGIVIVDFIDMERHEDKMKLLAAMQEALKRDRTKTHLVGMTELGLVQITRKRVARDLEDTIREKCPWCRGTGMVPTPETLRIRTLREIKRVAMEARQEGIVVTVNPRIAMHLLGWEGEELDRLEKQLHKEIWLRADVEYHRERIEVHPITQRDVKERLTRLKPGETVQVLIEETFGHNLQSGLGLVDGVMVEVQGAGNLVGEKVPVAIGSTNRWFCQAHVKQRHRVEAG
ncbi:MAG: Rne/Rng family ribonuclease [Candidatus Xenobia bacterium]